MARPAGALLGPPLAFAAALAASAVGGCNVHELGHLLAGRLAGEEVLEVSWCLPASGSIVFATQEPAWVSFAGGLLAAAVLAAVYAALVLPRLASPGWWAAVVAVLGTAVSQLIVALVEGGSPSTYESAQGSAGAFVLVFLGPLLGAALVQRRVSPPRRGRRGRRAAPS